MSNQDCMHTRLEFLRLVFPPTGIVHVGAGTGTVAERYESWEVPTAVFVEADEAQFDKLDSVVSGKPGWAAHLAVVSNRQAETDFYIASNPRESGLIAPDHLTGLWRNLKASAKQRRQTITLESLLATEVDGACPLNWLIIDCLSAVPILEGSDLDTWDVILARVILDAEQYLGQGATKAEVDELLEARGYRYLICEEELHPSLGSALYIHDRKSEVVQLRQQLDQAKARLAEHVSRIEDLTQEREGQAKLLAEGRKELDQAEASEEKLAFELQHKVEQLRKLRDEQVHLQQGYREQLESVSHEKQALEKTHAVLQDQLVEQQRQTQYWHEETEKRQQEGEERRKRIEQLEQQLAEQDHRQRLLDEEVLKAEAQIELIKDILLREKAF